MHLSLTRKTNDWLKQDLIEVDVKNDFFAWHVNYQIVNRKKLLVLVNDLTRVTIVLFGVLKKEMLDIYFLKSVIFRGLDYLNIPKDDIELYLNIMPNELTFSKTQNRTQVARMNRVMNDALNSLEVKGITNYNQQIHIYEFINSILICESKEKGYFNPLEKFNEYINLLKE